MVPKGPEEVESGILRPRRNVSACPIIGSLDKTIVRARRLRAVKLEKFFRANPWLRYEGLNGPKRRRDYPVQLIQYVRTRRRQSRVEWIATPLVVWFFVTIFTYVYLGSFQTFLTILITVAIVTPYLAVEVAVDKNVKRSLDRFVESKPKRAPEEIWRQFEAALSSNSFSYLPGLALLPCSFGTEWLRFLLVASVVLFFVQVFDQYRRYAKAPLERVRGEI